MISKRFRGAYAQFGIGLLVCVEAVFFGYLAFYVMPKCRRVAISVDMRHEGMSALMAGGSPLMHFFLFAKHFAVGLMILLLIVWVLFEWRMGSERKDRVRLSAMVSCALLLFLVNAVAAIALIFVTANAADAMTARRPEQLVQQRLASLDRMNDLLDEAIARKDWPAVLDISHTAAGDAYDLQLTGAAAPALLTLNQSTKVEEVRQQLHLAHAKVLDIWMASRHPDAARIETDMREYRDVYKQLRQLAMAQPPQQGG